MKSDGERVAGSGNRFHLHIPDDLRQKLLQLAGDVGCLYNGKPSIVVLLECICNLESDELFNCLEDAGALPKKEPERDPAYRFLNVPLNGELTVAQWPLTNGDLRRGNAAYGLPADCDEGEED